MSNLTIRYIPSAFDSAGGVLETYKYYPKMVEEMVSDLDQQEQDVSLGVLANAYSEASDLEAYDTIFRPYNIPIYADSGGLQVITLGKVITPELKTTIFTRQAKYSDLAMSFDEIPKKVLGRSNKGSSFGLEDVWIDNWFKDKAIESGQNIVNQIQEFKKVKNCNGKILFIIQARDFETAREWSWFMFQEIKKEPGYEDYIAGLALGSTPAAGPRYLSDFILRFQHELEFLPLAWRKNLHVLGAGSASRIIAALVTSDKYFLPGTIVSADSTTQTRAMVFGNFVQICDKHEKMVAKAPGRTLNEDSHEVVRTIYKYAKPYFDKYQKDYNLQVNNIEDFRNHYSEYNDDLMRLKKDFIDLHGDDDNGVYQYKKRARISRFFWSMSMMSDLLKFFESVKTRSHNYRASVGPEKAAVLGSLKRSLPTKIFRSVNMMLNLKDHAHYMEKDEILTGHPYTTVLPALTPVNGIVKHKGQDFITDFYNGELIGRPLVSKQANKNHLDPSSRRKMLLSYLPGITIDTIPTEDTQEDELDAW